MKFVTQHKDTDISVELYSLSDITPNIEVDISSIYGLTQHDNNKTLPISGYSKTLLSTNAFTQYANAWSNIKSRTRKAGEEQISYAGSILYMDAVGNYYALGASRFQVDSDSAKFGNFGYNMYNKGIICHRPSVYTWSSFTLDFWFKSPEITAQPDKLPDFMSLLNGNDGTMLQLGISGGFVADSNSHPKLIIFIGSIAGGPYTYTPVEATINDGNWHHVAFGQYAVSNTQCIDQLWVDGINRLGITTNAKITGWSELVVGYSVLQGTPCNDVGTAIDAFNLTSNIRYNVIGGSITVPTTAPTLTSATQALMNFEDIGNFKYGV